MKSNSRRSFIKKTAIATAGLSLIPSMSFASDFNLKKDKLKIAFIGIGLRGTNHLNNALQRKDVEVVAICDLDQNRIDIALEVIKKAQIIIDNDLRFLLCTSFYTNKLWRWIWLTRMHRFDSC